MCLFGLQASNPFIVKLAASPLASRGFAPRGDQKFFFGEIRKRTKEIFSKKNIP